jgi:transcriptional regulator with XRE-family HTH domain
MESATLHKVRHHARQFVRAIETSQKASRAFTTALAAHAKAGGSMKDIAEADGVSAQYLSDLKLGRRDLSMSVARKLAGL